MALARYVNSVCHVTVVAWPFYGFVSLFSLELLRLMFGPQWDAAAPLVPVFCLAGAAAATVNLITSVVLALGRVDIVTKVELFFQPLRAALVVMAAVTFQSMMACAVALAVAFALHVPLMYFVKGRCLPNDRGALLRGLGLSLKVSMLALALPLCLSWAGTIVAPGPRWLAFCLAVPLCVVSWLFGLMWLKHPLSRDPIFLRVQCAVLSAVRRQRD